MLYKYSINARYTVCNSYITKGQRIYIRYPKNNHKESDTNENDVEKNDNHSMLDISTTYDAWKCMFRIKS